MDHACLTVRVGFDLPAPFEQAPTLQPLGVGANRVALPPPTRPHSVLQPTSDYPIRRPSFGLGWGAMSEDGLSKAERYRAAAHRYGELATEAEPGYLAEVYRKIAAQYLARAGDLLKWADHPKGDGPDRDQTKS